jgi:hypothetical protein
VFASSPRGASLPYEVEYGPFPAAWPTRMSFSWRTTVDEVTYLASVSDTLEAYAAQPFQPELGAVRQLLIDGGGGLYATKMSAEPELRGEPPLSGADHYTVSFHDGQGQWRGEVVTRQTAVRLMPGILAPGTNWLLSVTALRDATGIERCWHPRERRLDTFGIRTPLIRVE